MAKQATKKVAKKRVRKSVQASILSVYRRLLAIVVSVIDRDFLFVDRRLRLTLELVRVLRRLLLIRRSNIYRIYL